MYASPIYTSVVVIYNILKPKQKGQTLNVYGNYNFRKLDMRKLF